MAAISTKFFLSLFCLTSSTLSQPSSAALPGCGSELGTKECHNKTELLKLKTIAIAFSILTSMIGVSLPLFYESMPALKPDKDLFTLVKSFASGAILATGYILLMPDSFNCPECLQGKPGTKLPFNTFVAMLSALLILTAGSFALSYYKKYCLEVESVSKAEDQSSKASSTTGQLHGSEMEGHDEKSSQLVRHPVMSQVLELGIAVHSVVIGLSDNQCTIRPLITALCFHLLFEGMILGGRILKAECGWKMKAIMVFFFSNSATFGIAVGISFPKVYSLIVLGLLNASSAALLNYIALVDLLANEFMGPKLQNSTKLRIWAYLAVFLGVGAMPLLAKSDNLLFV